MFCNKIKTMKFLILSLILIVTGFSAIKAQNQYRTLDKELIEKKTYDASILGDQTILSNYFSVYKIILHPDNQTKLNNSSRNSLLSKAFVKDITSKDNSLECHIYSAYGTDHIAIKNALYDLNFKFIDYEVSYATTSK